MIAMMVLDNVDRAIDIIAATVLIGALCAGLFANWRRVR